MLNEELNAINFCQKAVKKINIGLIVLCFMFVVGFIVSLARLNGYSGKDSFYKKSGVGIVPQKLVKKSVKYYDRILSRRKLFVAQSGIKPAKSKGDQPQAVPGIDISQLQLLGVISGGQAPQAIINDVQTDRSFYCYGGENIEGFIVEQVQEDKVILKKGQDRFELRL